MIDGTGFFLVGNMVNGSFTNVKDSGLNLSRVGIFRVDENGYLVDDQRSYVYGYALVDGTGIPETPAKACVYSAEQVMATYTAATGNNPATITIAGITVTTTAKNAQDMETAVNDWLTSAPNETGYTDALKNCKVEFDALQRPLTVEANGNGTCPVKFTVTANETGEGSNATVADALKTLSPTAANNTELVKEGI